MATNLEEESGEEFFEISAVSKLTGLSTHVLRVWERRYGVVEPDRSDSRRRRYHRQDIRRLTLLKALVDYGDRISAIAKLDIEALEERLQQTAETEGQATATGEQCRIGLVAVQARRAVHEASETLPGLKVSAEHPSLEALERSIQPGSIDVLIVETGNLFPETLERLEESLDSLRARRAIAVYQFASARTLATCNTERVTLLKSPVRASEIVLACAAEWDMPPRKPKRERQELPTAREARTPERLFTDEQLASLADAAPIVACECPQHLAQLLGSLAAFEQYSLECEDRNEEDAKLHAFLHQATAECRRKMEETLGHLLDAEGIEI